MEQVDKKDWQRFKEEYTQKLTLQQYKLVCKLHSKYFNHKYTEPCLSCNTQKFLQWIDEIDKLYD